MLMIPTVVLYRFQIRSLTLRGKHKAEMLENRVLNKVVNIRRNVLCKQFYILQLYKILWTSETAFFPERNMKTYRNDKRATYTLHTLLWDGEI
jgi:hypothetical protein